MRILVVHNHYRSDAPSGERTVVEQETAALRSRGHDVRLFERFSDDIVGWSRARKATLPVEALWGVSSHRQLAALLQSFRPDVVHVHNLFPLISPTALTACREQGIPIVATIHNYKLACASGDFFREGEPCFECAGGAVMPALAHGCYHESRAHTALTVTGMKLHRSRWQDDVSAYIFISDAQRRLLRSVGLPPERSFVKHNFIRDGLRPVQHREKLVTYLGRLEAAKGVALVMQAWDKFAPTADRLGYRLAVVGGGPMAEKVAAWAGGHASVTYHGLLPRHEAMTVLARSRLSLAPSTWHETFGLVAVESMALGIAPVASDRGAFPELVEDGVTGRLVDPSDAEGLVEILIDLTERPERYDGLGRAARRAFEERFTADVSVDRLESIYRFAIDTPLGSVPSTAGSAG
jgi:glycosyltransferase involved in cell wall biosynthesis